MINIGERKHHHTCLKFSAAGESGDTLAIMEEEEPEKEEREAECRAIVESIRHEEFGVGIELDREQQRVAEKQREREGRGLQRLSLELYSKDTHFVLELIQNADDNTYSEETPAAVICVPALKFLVNREAIVVLNNEVGFSERNVRAICDVGKSTKGAHRSGYIGQKGIGFKSVFRITNTPVIHSNGFHIKFDASCDPIGYILPHWCPPTLEEEGENSVTDERCLIYYVVYCIRTPFESGYPVSGHPISGHPVSGHPHSIRTPYCLY